MLSDRTRKELADKVQQYFGTESKPLVDSALRLQDDGYPDTEVINILKGAYNAGYDQAEFELR